MAESKVWPHRHCVICYKMIEDKLIDRKAIRFCSDTCKEDYYERKKIEAKMRKVAWTIVGVLITVVFLMFSYQTLRTICFLS